MTRLLELFEFLHFFIILICLRHRQDDDTIQEHRAENEGQVVI